MRPTRGGKRRIRGVTRSILGRDRPGGGGASLERTRLRAEIPCYQRKYRELRDFERLERIPGARKARDSADLKGQFPKQANRDVFTRIREEI